MQNVKKIFKTLWHFSTENYFISIFLAILIFVGFVTAFKLITAKQETVYAKVKISQGLWWASTLKPSLWMAQAVHKGDREQSLTGKPIVEVLTVRSYPWLTSGQLTSGGQYDIYLTLKLQVDINKKTGKYTFKRSVLAVGSPIDLELPGLETSATVMGLSEEPFPGYSIEKIITLQKKEADPWEADAIQVGDQYNDGEETVFEVVDKKVTDTYAVYNSYPIETLKPVNIELKARIKVQKIQGIHIFREEDPVILGGKINIQTSSLLLDKYTIAGIE